MDEEKKSENEKLIEAVAEGDEGLVKVLLHNKNQKLNVNFQDKNGETALHKAMKGWEGIVKLLVAHGSNIDLQDQIGWTPLHLAAFHGHEGTAKILLEHGPNIDLQDQDGWTALHFAALKSFQKIVKILVEYGSNINLQDPYGKTALYRAVEGGFEESVKILLDAGAHVHLKTKEGKTVFDVVENQKIIELITQFKCKNIKPAVQKKCK